MTTTAKFSETTLQAVAELIFYRPHPKLSPRSRISHPDPAALRRVFRKLGYHPYYTNFETYDSVLKALNNLNNRNPEAVMQAVHWVCDPRYYLDEPAYYRELIKFLNRRLKFDGYELRKTGEFYRLHPIVQEGLPVAGLRSLTGSDDYQSVQDELGRAMAAIDNDPADAITAACSMVESVCKSILDQMGKPYPSKKDISGLTTELAKHLDLLPAGGDIGDDVKRILSGSASIAMGVGALRTHAGDAHGRGMMSTQIEPMVARLAVNAAATLTEFYIEAWNQKQRGKKPNDLYCDELQRGYGSK